MEKKDILREKLDGFIRKFYQNRLIKGLIYAFGLGMLYFFAVSLLEYVGHFDGQVRFGMFIMLCAGLLFLLVYYILIPALQIMSIGRRISYEKAATIIGKHFPEVDDKILNTLQLQKKLSREQSMLIQASLEQRMKSFSPIAFGRAINLKENKKYWPILVAPMAVFLVLWISGKTELVTEGGKRIVEYKSDFSPKAPFEFILLNDDLRIEEGDDIEIRLRFSGNTIPSEAEMIADGSGRRMLREGDDFYYKLENVNDQLLFSFRALGFESVEYQIDVVPVPRLQSMQMIVTPPAYTGLKSTQLDVEPYLELPEGSDISWQLKVDKADKAVLETGEGMLEFNNEGGLFSREHHLMEDLKYRIVLANGDVSRKNGVEYSLNAIKDRLPEIEVEFEQNDAILNTVFFNGKIVDDYGFSLLRTVIEVGDKKYIKPLPFDRSSRSQVLSDAADLDSLVGEETQTVKLYVEVGDNDGVNGTKVVRSREWTMEILGKKDLKEQIDSEYSEYFESRQKLMEENERLQNEIEALRNKLLNQKELSWEDRTKLDELLEKKKKVLEELKKKEEEVRELEKKEEKLEPKSDEIKQEEEKIDDIRDDSKEDELEKLMEEIQELMDKLKPEKLLEKLKEMQQMDQQQQRHEERLDQLLKNLEFQKDLLEQADKMDELSKKMDELSNESEGDQELSEQEQVEKEMKESLEKINEMKKENGSFEKEMQEQDSEQSEQEMQEQMEQAGENQKNNKQKKANQNQKNASDKMQEMSQQLQMAMMQMQSGANQEDMEALRQILENLETLSFGVEELSADSKEVQQSDPRYRQLLVKQRRLAEGTRLIEDSLVSLSKRIPEIREVVFEELEIINKNLEESIDNLEEQRGALAAADQQYIMTSANNLALLLDESLRNMQQQMSEMMKGNQSCQKPGSKPSMSNIAKMQGELGQQMQKSKDGKKKGESQSREMVEMLSRQEQLRKMLEEMSEQLGNDGSKGNLQDAIEQMKELERDLLEGDLDNEFMERIKDIETRLLESERAELEQREDEKRESRSAEDLEMIRERELEEYLKKKQSEREEIIFTPLNLKPYYENRASEYLKEL